MGESSVALVTPTLLIVDDEKSTRDGLRTALEDKFDVYAAADAIQARRVGRWVVCPCGVGSRGCQPLHAAE